MVVCDVLAVFSSKWTSFGSKLLPIISYPWHSLFVADSFCSLLRRLSLPRPGCMCLCFWAPSSAKGKQKVFQFNLSETSGFASQVPIHTVSFAVLLLSRTRIEKSQTWPASRCWWDHCMFMVRSRANARFVHVVNTNRDASWRQGTCNLLILRSNKIGQGGPSVWQQSDYLRVNFKAKLWNNESTHGN